MSVCACVELSGHHFVLFFLSRMSWQHHCREAEDKVSKIKQSVASLLSFNDDLSKAADDEMIIDALLGSAILVRWAIGRSSTPEGTAHYECTVSCEGVSEIGQPNRSGAVDVNVPYLRWTSPTAPKVLHLVNHYPAYTSWSTLSKDNSYGARLFGIAQRSSIEQVKIFIISFY